MKTALTGMAPLDMGKGISLRKASLQDSGVLLSWRNDEATRRNSVNMETVTLETHEKWLREKMTGPDTEILIAEEDGEPVGTVRAEINGDEAELSWTVAPGARGRGMGKAMVAAAIERLERKTVTARIRPENSASVRIAESAGFVLEKVSEGLGYWKLARKR